MWLNIYLHNGVKQVAEMVPVQSPLGHWENRSKTDAIFKTRSAHVPLGNTIANDCVSHKLREIKHLLRNELQMRASDIHAGRTSGTKVRHC